MANRNHKLSRWFAGLLFLGLAFNCAVGWIISSTYTTEDVAQMLHKVGIFNARLRYYAEVDPASIFYLASSFAGFVIFMPIILVFLLIADQRGVSLDLQDNPRLTVMVAWACALLFFVGTFVVSLGPEGGPYVTLAPALEYPFLPLFAVMSPLAASAAIMSSIQLARE